MESLGMKNVSYLQARDPSIVAWNRANIRRINLADELKKSSVSYAGIPFLCKEEEEDEEYDDHIKVFLRIKGPISDMKYYEIDGNNLVCKIPEGSHSARNLEAGLNMTTTYSFSKIFAPNCSQIQIFDSIVKCNILDFINGRNRTLFTYGTSGSGKTYTIVGTPEQPGIIPRSLEYMFRSLPELPERPELMPLPTGEVEMLTKIKYNYLEQKKLAILSATSRSQQSHIGAYRLMQERLSTENPAELDITDDLSISVWVSFAEIYNETLYDLLDGNPNKKQRNKLKLGQYQDNVYIRDLTSVNVVNGIEAYQMLQYGLHNLNYAATGLNSHSSRSHGIFTIKLVQYSRVAKTTQISCFNFCDLAGSERLKKTLNVGDRLKESNNINKSLHVLGRCIKGVKTSQKTKNHFIVPFRESKLTQLFQNALMGNENISIIINMNPAKSMFEESRHALDFSALSKEISIQEKPSALVPVKNRFSEIIERDRRTMENIKIDNNQNIRDEEKERLEEMVIQLTNEIEQLKAEKDIEIREEKEYVRDMYEKFIRNKTERDNVIKEREKQRLREKYEDEIKGLKRYIQQLLTEKENVIDISSTSSESSFCEERHKFEDEIEQKNLEIERLKQLEKGQSLEIENLKQLVKDKDLIISDAKDCYFSLEEKNKNLLNINSKLVIENMNLKRMLTDMGMCYSCSCSSDEEEDCDSLEIEIKTHDIGDVILPVENGQDLD